MKFRRISFLLAMLALAALTACASMPTDINASEGFGATYPSQLLTGDVYILKNHEKIDGNISGIGTTLIIEEGAMVMGDISLVASNLEVNGRVAGISTCSPEPVRSMTPPSSPARSTRYSTKPIPQRKRWSTGKLTPMSSPLPVMRISARGC